MDLLGGFDAPAPPPSAAPAAAGLTLLRGSLDAGTFQQKWGSLTAVQSAHRQLQVEGVTPAVLEQLLGVAQIQTMASGTVGGETKMYMYAQSIGGGLFLVEIIVTQATRRVLVTAKSENVTSDLASQFLDLVWEQLSAVIT